MPSRKQRILGALLGVHAGDSLGATHEFSSWQTIGSNFPDGIPHEICGGGPFAWPPGHATDDTDLTRAVLLAYAETRERRGDDNNSSSSNSNSSSNSLDVAIKAGMHMLQWYQGPWPGRPSRSRPLDAGASTTKGLTVFAARGGHDPRRSGSGQGQAGNGSLMRCIPTALFAPNQPRLIEESALISAVTHDDWRCVLACVAYNVMARALVDGAPPAAAVEAGLAVLTDDNNKQKTIESIVSAMTVGGTRLNTTTLPEAQAEVAAAIEKARAPEFRVGLLAAVGPHATWDGVDDALPLEGRGYVLESLMLAVAAVLDTERSLEDLLVDVVRVGRDTDTNGAVAGGLLGARDGVGAIPASWRDKLQFTNEFTEIVDSLVVGGEEEEPSE